MKLKFHPLLALLAMLIGLTACSEMAAANAVTTDPADITLIPYTNEEFGISGLVPEGWLEVKPGQFLRMPGNDPTLLGQVAFHGVTREQAVANMQLPESIGSMETSNLVWDLYGAGVLCGSFVLSFGITAVVLIRGRKLKKVEGGMYE